MSSARTSIRCCATGCHRHKRIRDPDRCLLEKTARDAAIEFGPTGWHIGILCPRCVKAALDDENDYALDFPLGEQLLVAISDRPDWRVVIIPD